MWKETKEITHFERVKPKPIRLITTDKYWLIGYGLMDLLDSSNKGLKNAKVLLTGNNKRKLRKELVFRANNNERILAHRFMIIEPKINKDFCLSF